MKLVRPKPNLKFSIFKFSSALIKTYSKEADQKRKKKKTEPFSKLEHHHKLLIVI